MDAIDVDAGELLRLLDALDRRLKQRDQVVVLTLHVRGDVLDIAHRGCAEWAVHLRPLGLCRVERGDAAANALDPVAVAVLARDQLSAGPVLDFELTQGRRLVLPLRDGGLGAFVKRLGSSPL
jgi:hypothetical protein